MYMILENNTDEEWPTQQKVVHR